MIMNNGRNMENKETLFFIVAFLIGFKLVVNNYPAKEWKYSNANNLFVL